MSAASGIQTTSAGSSATNCEIKVELNKLKMLTLIEYPCFVTSESKALELIGGVNSLQEIIYADDLNNAHLKLDLHRKVSNIEENRSGVGRNGGKDSDVYSDAVHAPLTSEYEDSRHHTTQLVIKIRRRKGKTAGMGQNSQATVLQTSEPPTIEVLGRITGKYNFTRPADVQFTNLNTAIAMAIASQSKTDVSAAVVSANRNQIYECAPHTFIPLVNTITDRDPSVMCAWDMSATSSSSSAFASTFSSSSDSSSMNIQDDTVTDIADVAAAGLGVAINTNKLNRANQFTSVLDGWMDYRPFQSPEGNARSVRSAGSGAYVSALIPANATEGDNSSTVTVDSMGNSSDAQLKSLSSSSATPSVLVKFMSGEPLPVPNFLCDANKVRSQSAAVIAAGAIGATGTREDYGADIPTIVNSGKARTRKSKRSRRVGGHSAGELEHQQDHHHHHAQQPSSSAEGIIHISRYNGESIPVACSHDILDFNCLAGSAFKGWRVVSSNSLTNLATKSTTTTTSVVTLVSHLGNHKAIALYQYLYYLFTMVKPVWTMVELDEHVIGHLYIPQLSDTMAMAPPDSPADVIGRASMVLPFLPINADPGLRKRLWTTEQVYLYREAKAKGVHQTLKAAILSASLPSSTTAPTATTVPGAVQGAPVSADADYFVISKYLLRQVAPYVSYHFTAGPYKSCWIRYQILKKIRLGPFCSLPSGMKTHTAGVALTAVSLVVEADQLDVDADILSDVHVRGFYPYTVTPVIEQKMMVPSAMELQDSTHVSSSSSSSSSSFPLLEHKQQVQWWQHQMVNIRLKDAYFKLMKMQLSRFRSAVKAINPEFPGIDSIINLDGSVLTHSAAGIVTDLRGEEVGHNAGSSTSVPISRTDACGGMLSSNTNVTLVSLNFEVKCQASLKIEDILDFVSCSPPINDDTDAVTAAENDNPADLDHIRNMYKLEPHGYPERVLATLQYYIRNCPKRTTLFMSAEEIAAAAAAAATTATTATPVATIPRVISGPSCSSFPSTATVEATVGATADSTVGSMTASDSCSVSAAVADVTAGGSRLHPSGWFDEVELKVIRQTIVFYWECCIKKYQLQCINKLTKEMSVHSKDNASSANAHWVAGKLKAIRALHGPAIRLSFRTLKISDARRSRYKRKQLNEQVDRHRDMFTSNLVTRDSATNSIADKKRRSLQNMGVDVSTITVTAASAKKSTAAGSSAATKSTNSGGKHVAFAATAAVAANSNTNSADGYQAGKTQMEEEYYIDDECYV